MKKNEGMIERSIQVTIAVSALIGGVFWLSGAWQIVAMLFAAMVGTFATIGFCPLYVLIGRGDSCSVRKLTRGNIIFLVVYAATLLIGGSLVSGILRY